MYADGCVCVSHNKTKTKIKIYLLEITLCEKDRGHLEKFRECIKTDASIKDKTVKLNNKEYKSVRLSVCCNKMCLDLIKLGCASRKTYIISFPSDDIVPERYKRDFIRGYFDGDGCICVPESTPNIIIANFTGIIGMLSQIQAYLFSKKIIDYNYTIETRKNNKACEVAFSWRQCPVIFGLYL